MSFRYELIFLNISERRCFFHTNTFWCVIIPRQRSFGKVMFSVVSVCHFVYGGVLVQGPGLPLYRVPAPATQNMLNLVQLATSLYKDSPPDMFKLFNMDPTLQWFPGHLQICPLWSTDCRQVGGWHSTDMPSCVFLKCSLELECESSVVLSKYEMWCKPYCKYRVTDHRKSWF